MKNLYGSLAVNGSVVMNWKDRGIVIWVACEGTAFMIGDLFCGFRIERQGLWRLETRERFKKSIFPELWFDKTWPALRLGDTKPGVQSRPLTDESTITLEMQRD